MKRGYPSISCIIATYNSEKTIAKCLQSVRDQKYPGNNIEIILADGDSKDATLEIASAFDVRIIHIPAHLQNAEYNKGVALNTATGDVLLMIDHDNVLPHNQWLLRMVQPLMDYPDVVGVNTLRFTYNRKESLINRYIALLGASDPLPFYLGKSDRLSYLYDSYNLYGKAIEKGAYYLVKFDVDHIPTLGANGFLVRRKLLLEHAKADPQNFFHIDVHVDLIKKGFDTYAYAKEDIIHLTGYKNISDFLYRRKLFMEQYHIQTYSKRRYSVYTVQDTVKLLLFVAYAATLIKPTTDAIRGYLKIHDPAWFLLPILSFILLIIYGYVVLKKTIVNYVKAVS